MNKSKSNFKSFYYTFIGELIVAIIVLILTYILSFNLTLFVIVLSILIIIIGLTYAGYLIYTKSKVRQKEEKRKKKLSPHWKNIQSTEREEFMPWMDED